MINADMRLYDFFTYGGSDDYGQPALSLEAQGQIKMAVYTSSQSVQDNVNYSGAQYVALTQDKGINDSYVIEYEGQRLKVLYVQNKGKYRQAFLGAM
jgi:hypothetical protein